MGKYKQGSEGKEKEVKAGRKGRLGLGLGFHNEPQRDKADLLADVSPWNVSECLYISCVDKLYLQTVHGREDGEKIYVLGFLPSPLHHWLGTEVLHTSRLHHSDSLVSKWMLHPILWSGGLS